MSLQRRCAFLTVIFTIMSEHILQAMMANLRQSASSSGANPLDFAISPNSIVQFEIKYRDGFQSYSTGCVTEVHGDDPNSGIGVAIAWSTWEDIESEVQRVEAVKVTLGDTRINFEPGEAELLHSVDGLVAVVNIAGLRRLVKPIPYSNTILTRNVKQTADQADAAMGMTAIWRQGAIVQMLFHVIEYKSGKPFFYATVIENGNTPIDVGTGSPFLIRLANQVYLAGIQVGYERKSGRNKVAIIDKP